MLKLYLFQVTATHRQSNYRYCRIEMIAAINPQTARRIVSDDYIEARKQYDVRINQVNKMGIKIQNITEQKKVGGGWLDLEKKK